MLHAHTIQLLNQSADLQETWYKHTP